MLKIFKSKKNKSNPLSFKEHKTKPFVPQTNYLERYIPIGSKQSKFSTFWKNFYIIESGKILSIICGAVLNFFAVSWFITPTQTYGGGILGASLIFYYLINHPSGSDIAIYQIFLIQLALNAPLIIFGFVKLGVKFTLFTLIYFSFQIILGLCLTNSGIIRNVVKNLFPWKHTNIPKSWVMMSCLIGGVIYGCGCVLVYNGTGSTGGTDFISVYLVKTRNKTIGIVNFILNLFVAVIGVIVIERSFIYLINVTFFGSIMFFGVYSFIIDYFLPKQRIVSMHIISKNEYHVTKAFKEANLVRGYTKISSRGGYTNDINIIFMVILSVHEYRKLVNIIYKYDPNAFIISNYVWKIKGNFKKTTWE